MKKLLLLLLLLATSLGISHAANLTYGNHTGLTYEKNATTWWLNITNLTKWDEAYGYFANKTITPNITEVVGLNNLTNYFNKTNTLALNNLTNYLNATNSNNTYSIRADTFNATEAIAVNNLTNYFNKTNTLALNNLTNYFNKTNTLALANFTNIYNVTQVNALQNLTNYFNKTIILALGNLTNYANLTTLDTLYVNLSLANTTNDQNLNTTSDVTFNNVTASENVTADFFIGNGSELTGISSGGVVEFQNNSASVGNHTVVNLIPGSNIGIAATNDTYGVNITITSTASGTGNVSQAGAVADTYFASWSATNEIENSTYTTANAVQWTEAYTNFANKTITPNITEVVGLENLTNYYNITQTAALDNFTSIYNVTQVNGLQNLTNYFNKTTGNATYYQLKDTINGANITAEQINSTHIENGTLLRDDMAPNIVNSAIHYTLTNGTSTIKNGWYCCARAVNNFTATAWEITSVDFTKGNFTAVVKKFDPGAGAANYTEANFSECSTGENITLAYSTFNEDTSLGSFNTSIVAGEYFGFNVTNDLVKGAYIVIK